MNIEPGQRVKLPACPEWGPGEVIAIFDGGKMVIYFALVGLKTLKGAVLEPIDGVEAAHPLLDNRIRSVDRGAKTRSVADMKTSFIRQFPLGFSDPRYLQEERDYKVKASMLLRDSLSQPVLAELIASSEFEEVSRRALAVVNKTNLIFPNEKMALKDGLAASPVHIEEFARSLDLLLYGAGEFQPRFESFVRTIAKLEASKWTIATYFPFLANPDQHMFLKPEVTQNAAEACDFELHYQSELNWRTYGLLLKFCDALRVVIADLNPRDMIDLQSFIWCIGERRS